MNCRSTSQCPRTNALTATRAVSAFTKCSKSPQLSATLSCTRAPPTLSRDSRKRRACSPCLRTASTRPRAAPPRLKRSCGPYTSNAMKFRATIREEGSPDEERVIEAPSRFVVYEDVQREGGLVVRIQEARTRFVLPAWTSKTIGSGVKRSQVIRVAGNLSAMLSAGLTLSRALSIIERQSSNKRLGRIAAGLSDSIRKGGSFHEALSAYPRVFSGLFVSMARAGEESGSLAGALAVVALQMERTEELTKKVRGAMIYPAIVLIAIVIVAVLMLMYVVPTLTKTFTELGVAIPLTTQIIVALSDFMAANVLLVFIGLVAFFVGLVAFVRSRGGRALVISLALP